MNKAVFFDKDGVINCERGEYNYKIEDFQINDGVILSLKELQKAGFLLIIITNQGGISKGIYTKNHVEILHQHLKNLLYKEGINLTEIYYCPHHSDNEQCLCRKPESLLIEKALARFKINSSLSYFIGDKETDIMAGKKAGLNTFKIKSNENLSGYTRLILKKKT